MQSRIQRQSSSPRSIRRQNGPKIPKGSASHSHLPIGSRSSSIYKIKLLFPPTLWEPLPYTINGKPFVQFAAETFKLISALEKNGILTAISDDQALMAKHAGYQGRETEFRELARRWFMAGDVESIAAMVQTINSNQFEGAPSHD